MMDRHTCKLCFRRFSNGRALGGHMRSHVAFASTTTSSKAQLQAPASPSSTASASHREAEASEQIAQVAEQAAEALMADREVVERAEEAKQLANYGLRENPRKSFRLVDPEFSSTFPAVDYAAGAGSSVVLQDRESETESSKPPSLRRRSKRRRRESPLPATKSEPSIEPEPVSSISDATSEEDVARCLMMLSRDVWDNSSSPAAKSNNSKRDEVEEEEEEEEEEEQQQSDESEEELIAIVRSRKGGRSRYQCGTCRKVFRSYQALGGHRASHKKMRACVVPPPAGTPASAVVEEELEDDAHPPHLDNQIQDADSEVNAAPSTGSTDRRIHECPVCFRIFSSGQALGGHKRSHLASSSNIGNPSPAVTASAAAPTGVAATTAAASATAAAPCHVHANSTKKLAGESLIDLNLPPPMDEEAEMSAVCDAEQ